MKRIMRAVSVVHHENTKNDWDTIWVISGDEGMSKSTLLKHILEFYWTLLYGSCDEANAEKIALDISQFANTLKEAKQFDVIPFDEAAEISNKRSMSKLNVTLAQTYMIIRGENLFTILVIPSIFDLEGYFAKRRVRALLHVYKRGIVAFYNRERVRKIIAINADKSYKKVDVVTPLFRDTFPRYKGILEEIYQRKKKEKMQGAREKLNSFLNNPEETAETTNEALMIRLKKLGLSNEQIGFAFETSDNTIGRRLRTLKFKKQQIPPQTS
jgi:hypothetical protein